MYDGEVVLFVPGKYSIDARLVCCRNLVQRVASLNFVDNLARNGIVRCYGDRLICHNELFADRENGGRKVIPGLQLRNRNGETGRNLRKCIATAHGI
jgi:hypothetical protein